jgi:hypothetical protein
MQENRLKGFPKAALQKTVHWAFDEHDRDGKALYRIWLISQPETFCSAEEALYLFLSSSADGPVQKNDAALVLFKQTGFLGR